jgi:hypothetical protein
MQPVANINLTANQDEQIIKRLHKSMAGLARQSQKEFRTVGFKYPSELCGPGIDKEGKEEHAWEADQKNLEYQEDNCIEHRSSLEEIALKKAEAAVPVAHAGHHICQ